MENYNLPFIYKDDSNELSDILRDDVLNASIERIKRNVLDDSDDNFDNLNNRIKYLSYPASRIIISLFDDRRVISKFIDGEADIAMEKIEDNDEKFESIIEEIGIEVEWVESFKDCRKREVFNEKVEDEYGFLYNHPNVEELRDEELYEKSYTDLHFIDYKINDKMLKMSFEDFTRVSTMERVRDWNTYNYPVSEGMIYLPFNEVRDFLHEIILIKISENLPIEVPDEIEQDIKSRDYMEKLNMELPEESLSYEIDEVKEGLFPPVMESILNDVREGKNLDHMVRFSVAAFLLELGMTNDEIVETFDLKGHFAEEPTRYQLRQMRKEGYIPPTYSTIESFGYEWEKDRLEQKVKHPLTYYRIKLQESEENEVESEDDKEEEENETTNKEES